MARLTERMQVMARAAKTGSNFFLFSFLIKYVFLHFSVYGSTTATGSSPACVQGRYRHDKKDGNSGKSGFSREFL